ncbi:MAG: hypothetical protein ACLFUU_05910 [Desulfobacteraceae bacterium]
MRVILNTWLGDGFENNNCCDLCGRLATTVELAASDNTINACKNCLIEAIGGIDQAILSGGQN